MIVSPNIIVGEYTLAPLPWMQLLVRAGIEVSVKLKLDYTDEIWPHYDLNLESKSHLYLRNEGDSEYDSSPQFYAYMRYNRRIPIYGWTGLHCAAIQGIHGRPFMNAAWKALLQSQGYDMNKFCPPDRN